MQNSLKCFKKKTNHLIFLLCKLFYMLHDVLNRTTSH